MFYIKNTFLYFFEEISLLGLKAIPNLSFLQVCFAHSLKFWTVFIPKENVRVPIRMIKNLCKMNLASIFYLLTHFFLEISQNKVIKTTFTLYVQDKLLFIFLFPVRCDSLIVPVFLPYLYICMFRMYESQTDL